MRQFDAASVEAPPVGSRVRRGPANVTLARRWQAAVLLVAVLVGALLLSLRPRHFYLNGQAVSLRQAAQLGEAVRLAGFSLTPGDLVDVQGVPLVRGGGLALLLSRNGQPAGAEAGIRGGDLVTVAPGRNLTEPVTTTLKLLPALPARSGSAPAAARSLAGLRREERGLYSGKLAQVETTQVRPVPVVETPEKLLGLTFDDGPSPTITPQILALLAQHGARATFFVLGDVAASYPDTLRQEYAAGMEIAVHSWSHPMLTKWDSARITADLERCKQSIRQIVGEPVPLRWMRPPYGDTNAKVKAAIEAAGLRQILWSVDTNDWRRPGASVIARRAIEGARPGAVVLMHDGGGPREGTVEAVRLMLPELVRQGFRMVTLSEMLGTGTEDYPAVNFSQGERRLRVEPALPPLRVEVDAADLGLTVPVLRCEGQVLLPAAPTLARLGAIVDYDAATQSLRVAAAGGEYRLPLDSFRAEVNGRPVTLQTPSLLYCNKAYLSLALITRITGATALLDCQNRVLRLFSAGAGVSGAGPAPQASLWLAAAGVTALGPWSL